VLVDDDRLVPEPVDAVEVLAATYLFEDLTREQLGPLAASARVRRLVRDERLFAPGDPAEELYVIVDGELKDSVTNMDGEQVVHFIHGPGMVLGEPGFFSQERNRIVEVRATRATTVLMLSRSALQPVLDVYPVVKDRALEFLASNSRWQTTLVSALATRPLEHRLLLRILELADSTERSGTEPASTPEITQSTLAAMVGASRENVNRALNALTLRGAIRRIGSRYVLPDEAAVRAEVAQDFPSIVRRDVRRA
jgi:CRP-like cAMP-binding protein